MPGLLDRDKKKAQCLSQHAHNGQGISVGRGLGHMVLNNTPGFNSDPDPNSSQSSCCCWAAKITKPCGGALLRSLYPRPRICCGVEVSEWCLEGAWKSCSME